MEMPAKATICSVNPATGRRGREFPLTPPGEIGHAVNRCHEAFEGWRRIAFPERARRMREMASRLRREAREHAEIMAQEMGKPVSQGRSEIEKCAWVCDYFADHAERMLKREEIPTDASKSYVTFPPLGVLLAIMPWNFPYWQVYRFAAPAIMAGNGVLLKHASNVPACAREIERLFKDSGFPRGLFETLFVGSETVDRLLENPEVRAVTLTGSGEAGRAVAEKAGSLLKKCVLELGGSDAYIVLEDADLEAAVATCVESRLVNSGQSCIAGKRFIVVESRQEEFERRFVERMGARKVGDPMREETEIGPLARMDLRERLHRQVTESVRKGAALLLGGRIPEGPGCFYPATVLSQVAKGMLAYEEELFGPVAAIISARDEDEAIRIANDSVFGLGAAVLTSNRARGERIAAETLECGVCFVNSPVRSDPRLPFGGVKESGYGRELSPYGIKEFVNIKTVVVN